MGLFISSLTESQAVAAGLCLVMMLFNYFISSLANYVSSTAFASYLALAIILALLCIILRLLTKNSLVALVFVAISEAITLGCYMLWSSKFEGLFANIMAQLSVFDRFYSFVDGVFDLTSIVYFLTVIGVFLFLTVQSLEKRRWN